MGLAAPKNRTRISNDPQNTTWSTNTTRFGHKLLTSQGWQPGTSLGARNASHAAHYTAASHSHVRVFLKEDNLGLGAKLGSEKAENFGLAGLESVLGRLNGREEEVKREEEERRDVDRRRWVSQRYGGMGFVSGGFLVGGDIVSKKELKEVEGVEVEVKKEEGGDGERKVLEVEEKRVKKRKRVKLEESDIKIENASEEPKLKRKKKSMDLRAEALLQDASEPSSATDAPSKSKKDKKSKKSTPSEPTSETPLSEKALRKAEKRARKEEKKLKKALKKAAKEAARSKSKSAQDTPADSSTSSNEDEDTESPASSSIPTTGTSTPITAAGLTFGAGGRHAVRQRYIRQKKMASMDPQALKEIFMIKT